MIAAVLMIASLVALSQFALYYWRAVLAGVASQALSERMVEAVGVSHESVRPADFRKLMNLHDLTPGLREHNEGLRLVRAYYSLVNALNHKLGAGLPQFAVWANREMTTCARYAAVVLDRRLTSNLECVAEIHTL